MILFEQLLSFVLVHLFIFIIPGPNTALVIRNTLKYGFKEGVLSAFGITLAIALHAGFALIAANILIRGFYEYFYYIKLMGVIYLGIFGLTLLKNSLIIPILALASPVYSKAENADYSPKLFAVTSIKGSSAFRMGFLLDLFNPYISLFYISVFPNYLVNNNSLPLMVVFGGMVTVLNLIWFSTLSYLVACSQKIVRNKINAQYLESLTGTAMLIFALFLFLKN